MYSLTFHPVPLFLLLFFVSLAIDFFSTIVDTTEHRRPPSAVRRASPGVRPKWLAAPPMSRGCRHRACPVPSSKLIDPPRNGSRRTTSRKKIDFSSTSNFLLLPLSTPVDSFVLSFPFLLHSFYSRLSILCFLYLVTTFSPSRSTMFKKECVCKISRASEHFLFPSFVPCPCSFSLFCFYIPLIYHIPTTSIYTLATASYALG